MNKIPLHTSILFVLALIPAVVFVVLLIIAVIYGDINGLLFCTFFEFRCNPAGSLFIALIVMFLQTEGIINYINTYKKVREYNESHIDNENYESIL